MECERHLDRGAVAQCQECGVGVCKECADKTAFMREDDGVLCPDCACNKVNRMVEMTKNDNKSRLVRIIISSICYVVGLLMFIFAFTDSEGVDPLFIIFGVVLCGFYTGITWKKAADQAHRQKEMEQGVEYVITENGIERKDGFWYKVVMCIIGTIIGVVYTPIRIATDSIQIKRGKKTVESLTKLISDIQSL